MLSSSVTSASSVVSAVSSTLVVSGISELSKLYENGMLTKEEFEHLKQEVIGSQ